MRKLVLILFVSVFVHLAGNEFTVLNDKVYNDMVRSVIGTDKFQVYTHNNDRFAVFREKDSLRFFIVSTDYSNTVGYQGTTTLGIIFKPDLTVQRLQIIKSQETRSYISRIKAMGFPQRFNGFKKDDEVQIATGATMTSVAIIKSVNECIEKFEDISKGFKYDYKK